MADIVLTTLNARYAHAAFGLRYLIANLGELRDRAELVEFDISQRPVDMLESLLARSPQIIGMGVYIWNATQCLELATLIKRIAPHIKLVLGGPEVSHETAEQAICALADHVICGEADLSFAQLCRQLLAGEAPAGHIIQAGLPDFSHMALPYDLYNEADIAHRVIYVEASRGCPFKCEFCLSSLDVPVRNVPLDALLAAMQSLLDRGVRQFKFVDRTFNLNLKFSSAILEFFLARMTPDLFLHFEMIPDRLPAALRGIIERFPPGALQFEVGIQTFNDEVAARISRRQNYAALEDNMRWLRQGTGVHVHADLIVGLPGEDMASFGGGFDRLFALRPQETQVGILKRLRGTPIIRHDVEWKMVYSPLPPYEVMQTRVMDFATLQRMRRFSRYWDLVANSGNFVRTLDVLLDGPSPFAQFLAFADWLYERTQLTAGLSLTRLLELVYEYLTQQRGVASDIAGGVLLADYRRTGHSDHPVFLREHDTAATGPAHAKRPKRQARHQGAV